MAAPALNELPKVATDLKSQLEGFQVDKLKNTEVNEKIVLPTAEGECLCLKINLIVVNFKCDQIYDYNE